MPRLHSTKKDFGLRSDSGVALPAGGARESDNVVASSSAASSSRSVSSYRSTMPAYGGGAGGRGGFNISSNSGSKPPPPGYDEGRERGGAGETKKSKGWFGGKTKRSKKNHSHQQSFIDDLAGDVERPSPILRRGGGEGEGEKDQFGRPLASPDDPEDEEMRMKLSYDVPENITKSKSLLQLPSFFYISLFLLQMHQSWCD